MSATTQLSECDLPVDHRQIVPDTAILEEENDEHDDSGEVFGYSSGLGAHDMIRKGSPTHHQALVKLHMPFWYRMLPLFMQRYICSTPCLEKHKWLAPKWKRRYLILTGNYLYKFKNEYSTSPKGTPVLVENCKARVVLVSDAEFYDNNSIDSDEGLQTALKKLPVGTQGIFAIEYFGSNPKTTYYGATTLEDARVWVQSLQQARQEIINANMGHSNLPRPETWDYYNKLGDRYVERKERIKARLEEYNAKEMEMTAMLNGAPLSTKGVYT